MTLALRRFRLDGVGPAGARFDPLDVDLMVDGAAARAAVLFLENGGGKSVLLRLLFSVVLPGRRQTVGSVKLDGYVGSGDTAHVSLEWATSDRPLVTGTVLEWRNRTRSGSGSNLLQLWYSFVPRSGILTLDDLPTREGDRRVTRTGFRERLTALAKEHPQLQLVIEDSPTKWAEHLLNATPLDPEIFRYQRQMNADEADAESLFAGVRTDDDFVRFVVEAVHDPEQLDGFDELLSAYAVHLGRHEDLTVEARFCAAAAAALRPFAEAATALAEARTAAATVRREAVRLRAELGGGAAVAEEEAERWVEQAAAAAGQVEVLRSEAHRLADTASELRRLEAVFLHDQAREAEAEARRTAGEARRTAAAWEHVAVVVDLRRHRAEVDSLREAQEASERELEPLRRAMENAAGRYAGRLGAEARALAAEAGEAIRRSETATREAADLAAEAAEAEREAGAAAASAASLRARVAEVAGAVADARREGVLGPAEPPDEARQRVQAALDEAGRRLDLVRGQRQAKDEALAEVVDALGDAVGERSRYESRRATVRRELDDHLANAAALVAEARVQEIAPDATDIWVVGDRVEDVLEASVGAAEAEQRSLRSRIEEVDRRLEQLGTDGLLPAAPDVVAVWDAIVAEGIGAATGWSWLAKLDDQRRRRILATNPALAGGVLVTDPDRVAEATDAVRAAGVETETVVLIGTANELDTPGAGHAAPVRPALYDPAWTERTRRALDEERVGLVDAQSAALAVLAVDSPLLSRLRDHRQRCPAHRRDSLRSEAAELDERSERAGAEVRRLDGERARLRQELGQLAREEPDLSRRLADLEKAHSRLDAVAAQYQRSETWEQQAGEADQHAATWSSTAKRLAAAADERRTAAESARRQAERAGNEAERRAETALKLATEPLDAPSDIPTEALAGAYDAARQTYQAEREGRDLTPAIVAAEQARDRCAERLAVLDGAVRSRAEELAATPGAEDPAFQRDRLVAARQSADAADALLGDRRIALGQAEAILEERKPKGRPRFIVLPPGDEPADAEEASRRASEQQALYVTRTREVREAEDAVRTAREREQVARSRATLLRSALDVLPVSPAPPSQVDHETDAPDVPVAVEEPTVEPWGRSVDEAQDAARAIRGRHESSERLVHGHERSLGHALAEVRAVANDPTLASVGGVRLALANEDPGDLAGRAALLAGELDAMHRSIQAELAETQRHREGIVQRLATLVEAQLRQLGQLKRLSKMPPGLGNWSDKPFVSVDFDQVAGAEITARLGPIVDAAAADARKRNGIDLLLAGMRAAVVHQRGEVERTYTVRLLRPNRMMAYERASIAELENEFSGGMKLTAAICTYCALAALRANNRSTGSLFGLEPGPLFLDNPLGKASADYLLDLQHALAEKLRVQLVHTTGVWDVEALATYQRVVRLRNLADLRHNVRRLRVDDDVHLPGTGATIDAVGFSLRGNGGP
jgi:hypothetical protein